MLARLTKPAPLGSGGRARGRRALYAGTASAGLLLAAVLWFAIVQPVQVLPRMRQAPAFTLTDDRGGWLSLDDLRGRPVLISFSYTRCGDGCATLTDRLRALRPALAQAGHDIQLLTISVDPAHDTPADLAAYAASIGAGDAGWRFLTGASSEIKMIVGEGFRVYYGPGDGGEIELDQRAVLLDASGMQRAEYSLNTLESARLLRDLELLGREQLGSETWQRPVYEAAHLFVCYPD